jgi:glycosyltransferase involved in cell wall biosynthesis
MTTLELPSVTVIMPIRNEEDFVQHSLGAVLAQDYPADRLEVLVVDGRSDDGTRAIVGQMLDGRGNARLLDNPGRIVPTALNIGLAAAQGEAIIRVDGHTIIAPDYVTHCAQVLAETGADCAGGPMRAVGETPFGQAVALATSHPFGVGGARFHYASQPQEVDTVYMGAWSRRVLELVGTFDEEMVRNQDDEFNYRLRAAGGRIWLDPDIRSTYYARSTLRSLWRQYYQYGYWKVRVFQKVPGSAQPRQWVPPLFVLGVVGGFLATLLLPWLRPLYLGGLALYIAANLAVSLHIASRTAWQHMLRLPVAFATLHLAYGLGFWMGILRFGPPWKREPKDG